MSWFFFLQLTARQAERELKEAKAENSSLRQKWVTLVLMYKFITQLLVLQV